MNSKPAWQRAGFSTPGAYAAAMRESQWWSNNVSKVERSKFNPRATPEEKGAYFRAYVSKATGIAAYGKRHPDGGSRQLRNYLMKHRGVSEEEWRQRYTSFQ